MTRTDWQIHDRILHKLNITMSNIERRKVELLNEVKDEAERLGTSHPWQVTLQLDEHSCLSLVGALQLALRHPKFQTRPTSKWIRGLVDDLIAKIPNERQKLKKIAELGFNQNFDSL